MSDPAVPETVKELIELVGVTLDPWRDKSDEPLPVVAPGLKLAVVPFGSPVVGPLKLTTELNPFVPDTPTS